jgi:hypothetical protein
MTMRPDVCVGCGTELSAGARYCVKCGRTQPSPVLDLQRVDVPPPPPGERVVERAVAEQRGSRAPRRGLAVLVALAVLAVGAVVVLSGGDGGDDDASAPTTTEESGGTTRPRRTTTTLPDRVVTQLPAAPLLGAPTGGLSVYVIDGRTVTRVELDSGIVTTLPRAFGRAGAYTSFATVRDGQLVMGRDNSVLVGSLDLAEPPTILRSVDNGGGPFGDRLLNMDYDTTDGAIREVREFDVRSEIVATWQLPAATRPAGVIDDRLVVQLGGRIYLVGQDGTAEMYAIGDVLRASGTFLIRRECDARMVCAVLIDDLRRGTAQPLTFVGEESFYGPFGLLLAPDGSSIVVMGDNGPVVVDVATGATIAPVEFDTGPAWSPDGAWLFTVDRSNDLKAWPTRGGGAPIAIELPSSGRIGSSNVVLAVG